MESPSEFEITPEMMRAGIDALCLYDRATLPEYVVWAIYQDMMKVAVATGVAAAKERRSQLQASQMLSG